MIVRTSGYTRTGGAGGLTLPGPVSCLFTLSSCLLPPASVLIPPLSGLRVSCQWASESVDLAIRAPVTKKLAAPSRRQRFPEIRTM